MIPTTLVQVQSATAGVLHGIDPNSDLASRQVESVVTDSRLVEPASLFVAIPGERVDGHDFASTAVASGALAVLASRPLEVPCIVVDDTVAALGRLAQSVRARLECTVIAITGSSGKTSTKDLLAEVLGAIGPTVAPQGSFNTEVGVPMTVCRAQPTTEFLILEMGMRGLGHIHYLCQVAQPDIGVILNIGSAHLGMVGSREGIAQAKGEILDLLPQNGTAVVLGDDPVVLAQAGRTSATLVTFGRSPSCDVRATDVRLDERARPSFTLGYRGHEAAVRLRLHGEHFVANALAVAAVALTVGMPVEAVARALSGAEPRSKWRMEVAQSAAGTTIVNDAYNANPESVQAALQSLAAMTEERQSWAVLGEMLELGDASDSEHAAIGRLAASLGITHLVCVGQGTIAMHRAAQESGLDGSTWVADADAAIDLLGSDSGPRSQDVVLVKASRGIGLDRVAESLLHGGRA